MPLRTIVGGTVPTLYAFEVLLRGEEEVNNGVLQLLRHQKFFRQLVYHNIFWKGTSTPTKLILNWWVYPYLWMVYQRPLFVDPGFLDTEMEPTGWNGETVELVAKHLSPGIGAKRNLATRSSTAEVCNPGLRCSKFWKVFFFQNHSFFSPRMASYLWNEISSKLQL